MKNPQSRFAGAKLFAALLGLTLCACQLNAELSWYGNVYGSGGDAPPSPASTGWTAGSGSFYIGENSYGMIDVDNVTVGIWYGTISVGDSQYASGEVTVRAGGWLTASAMIIGNSGSGNVILEGGKMQANNLTIGKYADAQGSLVVNSGASVDVWGYSTDTTTVGYVSIGGSSDYQAGGNNGTGSLHINGGTFNLSHTASAILVGATGYGTLTVSAGTLSAATLGLGGAEFRSSLGWGHNGMIYISGGVVNVSTLSSGYKDNGATQRHTLTLAGGTLSVSQGEIGRAHV